LSYIFMFSFTFLTIIKLALATLHRVFAFWKSMHWRILCSLNICYRPGLIAAYSGLSFCHFLCTISYLGIWTVYSRLAISHLHAVSFLP
jgi:hypothetical protein